MNHSQAPTLIVAARLAPADVARLDRIAAEQTRRIVAGRATRSSVASAALLRGLASLEAELAPKGKAR